MPWFFRQRRFTTRCCDATSVWPPEQNPESEKRPTENASVPSGSIVAKEWFVGVVRKYTTITGEYEILLGYVKSKT